MDERGTVDESAPTLADAEEQTRPRRPPIVVANYTIHEQLGAGGFGAVYRARQDKIGRDVAIKVLDARYSSDPATVARFVAEARAVNMISHPGIVEIFDFGELADGRSYFVMELLRGRSLHEYLRERTRLSIAEALPILTAIAEAIDAAHDVGIAHRDLKPENVFLLDDGSIKLIDFGIAKLTLDDTPVTEAGAVFGTPMYMSPEQCRGEASDTRTDAYSFGVLVYEVLVGEQPFRGDSLQIALHHLHDRPQAPSARHPELTDRVDRVVLSLLEKEPEARPPRLAAAIAGLAPDAPQPPQPRTQRRRRVLIAGVGAIATAAAVSIGYAVTRHESQPDADAACPAAASRLVGVWDAPTRKQAETRFAATNRPDASHVWQRLSSELDERNARWSTMWDQACRSPDRVDDPLLYAQRLTCLESALLETRSTTDVLADADAGSFMNSFSGLWLNPVEDCESNAILRAQPPTVAPRKRDEIGAIEADFSRTLVHAFASLDEQTTVTESLVESMRTAITKLEKAGSPRVSSDLIAAAQLMTSYAQIRPDDVTRASRGRAFAQEAVDFATSNRDDINLPAAYAALSDLEAQLGNRDVATEALERADDALVRAGRPAVIAVQISQSHARLDASRGRLDVALREYREAVALGARVPDVADNARIELALLLGRLGLRAEAAQVSRETVAAIEGRQGDTLEVTLGRYNLFWILLASGDLAGAREQSDKVITYLEATRGPSVSRGWTYLMRAIVETAAGNPTAALASAKAWAAAIANGRPITAPFLVDLAYSANSVGASELVPLAWAQAEPLHPGADQLALATDLRALVALRHHHDVEAVSLAHQVPADPKHERFAPWIVAIAEARAGHVASAESALQAARANLPAAPLAHAFAGVLDGLTLIELQRWRDAVAQLDRVHGEMAVASINGFALGELLTWLGIARLETGDFAGSRAALEEAVGIAWGLAGATAHMFFTPIAQFALGRALWAAPDASDNDRARAIRQVEAARDGFQLQGHQQEREQALAWLAAHPH